MRAVQRCSVALLTLLASACAARSPSQGFTGDRNVLTRAQLNEHNFATAFEAVEALRSNWLQPRGSDSFIAPSDVWVYLDNTRLGGVESLRSVATVTVVYIQYYDGVSATARWGLDHSQGVIFVATHH